MAAETEENEVVKSDKVKKRLALSLAVCVGLLLASFIALGTLAYKTGALASVSGGHDYPEAELYDASIDASGEVDAALARAGGRDVNVLLVLGANWCHDSRAFAGWMETERFASMLAERFEVVFVNVGMPQSDDGHNLHVAKRFGFDSLEGTPTVLVVAPDETVLNADTAKTWRNAASRDEDAIYDELVALSET